MQHIFVSRPFGALLILLFLSGCLPINQAIAQGATYTLTTTRIASTSAQLNWTAAPAPTTYDVRWRQQGAASWITSSEIGTTSFILDNLSDGQVYEWQMRPTASAVWHGNPASFTTSYGCSAPYPYSPYNVSVSAAVLSWSYYASSSSPVSYTLDVKPTEATSWSAVSFSATSPYYTLSNLNPSTTYVWRMRTACSPYSSTATFSTPSCTITNPQSEPLPTSANLRWAHAPGATYNLQWRPQGNNTWTSVPNLQASLYSTIGEYSLTALTPNTVYEWQVQPVCGTTTGTSTGPLTFTASCNAPTSISVVGVTSNMVVLSLLSPYTSYYSSFGILTQYRPQTPANAPWTITTSSGTQYNNPLVKNVTLSMLTPNTGYDIRVQVTCPGSLTSAFAEPPLSVSTTSCTNTATNLRGYNEGVTRYSFNWNGVYEHYYAVQYRPTGVGSWSQVGPPAYSGNTYSVIQNLLPNTTYEWRVVTYCTLSASAVTPSSSQTFATPACSTNRLSSFSTNDIDFDQAKIYWYEPFGEAGQYVARYRVVGTETYTTLPQQTAQWASLTGLANNTAYEWQVAAICDASATSQTFSAPRTFTTSCRNTANSLYTDGNQLTSIDLRWSNPSTSDGNYNRTYLIRYRPQGADWTPRTLNTSNYGVVLNVSALQTGTVYEWGVARQCSSSIVSDYTAGNSFSTSCNNSLYNLSTRDITPTRATLAISDNSYRYNYQIRYRVTGSNDWITPPTFTNSTYSLTGLTPYTAYEWQVAARCTNEFMSDYSPTQTFNSDCFVPTNLYSSGSSNSFYVSWNSNYNVASYTVQYRLQGTADWTSATVTSSSYNVPDVLGTYEWRVQTNCGSGLNSAFSATNTVSTYCYSPGTPTISALSSYGAGVSWSENTAGARYTLQWRAVGTSAWNTVTDLGQTTHTLTGMVDRTPYEVRVQAQCGNLTSGFSSLASFTATCSLPTGLSTLGFYSYESMPYQDFSWNVTSTIGYNLRWRPLAADNQPPVEWQIASDVLPNSRQLFHQAGTYEWQVQGICANGATSAYVGGSPFTINDCETKYIQYKTTAEATQALLSYSAFVNADVRWRPAGALDWNTVLNQNVFSSLKLEGLTENTAYEWQVGVHCLSGQSPTFGPTQSFTTTCAPPTRLTTACVDLNQASLFWTSANSDFVYGQYELNWRPVGTTNWSSLLINTYSHLLTGLVPATNYEWRVRAVCSTSANAAFSVPQTFYTQCSQPTALTARPSCNGISLEWRGACETNIRNTVWVRINYGGWSTYTTYSHSYYLQAVPSGTPIEYQVQSHCNGVSSARSNYYSFVSPSCPVTPCSVVNNLQQTVSATGATLSWQTSSNTAELQWRVIGSNWNSVYVSGATHTLSGLTNNSLIEWKVRSTCTSDFSPVSFFRTRCNNTFWITSIHAVSDSIKFYIVKPDSYEVRYRAESGSWTTRALTGMVNFLTGLSPNTRYELQLRASCGSSLYSDWTPSRFITTSCPMLNRTYADWISETSARLNWSHASPSRPAIRPTLSYRVVGATDWTVVSVMSQAIYDPFSYTLTNLSRHTNYEWMLYYDCGNGNIAPLNARPLTFRTLGTAPPCATMTTIRAGLWADATIWSCNRVPLPTDPVQVLHEVTVPDNGTGRALRVLYGAGGLVRFGTGARLLLGQ